jgi:hypothetical protein
MTTKELEIPTAAGAKFAGGIFAGRFFVGNQAYALIVADAFDGERTEIEWGSLKMVNGAVSYSDGLANTKAMAAAKSALAEWALALRIGGFDDWYIPSRLESLIAFGELQQTETFSRDWYWTSSQCASNDDYAWCQDFYGGTQGSLHKGDELRARAVRRLAI